MYVLLCTFFNHLMGIKKGGLLNYFKAFLPLHLFINLPTVRNITRDCLWSCLGICTDLYCCNILQCMMQISDYI